MGENAERTPGERTFEAYLGSQGLVNYKFEQEHEGKRKRPDYTLESPEQILFEVKDIIPEKNPEDGAYDGYRRIRQKIDDARKKFKEYNGIPCCLVLYNCGASDVHLEMPEIMLGAMEGNAGISIPILARADEADYAQVFLHGGKMNRGLAFNTRADDALPGALRRVLDSFDATGAQYQFLTDKGSPSPGKQLGTLDLDIVDVGIPSTGARAPMELISTLDLYQAAIATRGWLTGP